ncbi:uncharacterized protein LOC101240934 [Hydra vulgaris]|uniref:Uncharacterized protein LOC101240934 n=1 Tax=Hydra vulgaris TaxID=6087 RepID=A0ABM4CVR6_HYDVU
MAMHLIKSLFSGTLVACSLIWLIIQHLFVPQELLKRWLVERSQDKVDFLQLERDWCRVRSKAFTWREMIESCQEKSLFLLDPRYSSSSQLSRVGQVTIRPAGEHTLIRIDTYTKYGVLKSFGGDSFRVSFYGADVVSAAVFDLKNGSYEALALLLTPGEYRVDIFLEYTQCNGFKDPPTDWYLKAHCSRNSSNTIVPDYISSSQTKYINELVSPGFRINVPETRYNLEELQMVVRKSECGFSCKKIWDGYGVWSKDGSTWKPYKKLASASLKEKKEKQRQKWNILWIYGDSISYYFHYRLQKTHLCKKVFNICGNTYNWIYPKTLYEMRHFCEDFEVDVGKILKFFRDVILNKKMDKDSVLIFNLGAHFVKNTSFRKYKEIIDGLIEELHHFKGRAIWKSTTAIHQQDKSGNEVMGAFRRYLTNQRVQLFNAYANAAICNADHDLLDIHPLTASYPGGTKDGVHYLPNASVPIENLLNEYFSK